MKSNKIIIGSLGIVAIIAFFITAPFGVDNDAQYSQKGLSALQEKNADDARAWIDARYTDVRTGEKATPETLNEIKTHINKMNSLKAAFFIDNGPDNIGGRTRAICIDRSNNNRVWAGGVSGGLWNSWDGGNRWYKAGPYPGSPFISSMTMTKDGKLFVATGSNAESWSGDGLWMTADDGATFSVIPGTETMSTVNQVVSDNVNNKVWMATSSGIYTYDNASGALTDENVGSGPGRTIQISGDGQVIIAAVGSNRVYVSTDGGGSWDDKTGLTSNNLIPQGAPRIEFAISHNKNGSNMYSLYAIRTNNNLMGMSVSHDNGATWHEFVGSSSGGSLDIYRGQGTYNTIVTVSPDNPEKIFIGGIDVWQWEQNVDNPPSGGFEKLTNWFAAPSTPQYVHADNHEMKWTSDNLLFIGNDGGIGKSDNQSQFWPANRGYNVTQFYGIAFDKNGSVMGGTQDNGSLYNDHSNNTWQEFIEVSGGDGFLCAISFENPSVMFSTIYYNSIARSGDAGSQFTSFVPNFPTSYGTPGSGGGVHPFVSSIFLHEYYDENSEDSVTFIPMTSYTAGDEIQVPSAATGDTMTYVTPDDIHYSDTLDYNPALNETDVIVTDTSGTITYNLTYYDWTYSPGSGPTGDPEVDDTIFVEDDGSQEVVIASVENQDHYYGENDITGEVFDMGTQTQVYGVPWDTLIVQDPYQSWFFVYTLANGGELWATRDALRLSQLEPQWAIVAQGIGTALGGSNGNMRVDVEMSKDLEHCYIVAGSGVYRLDSLGSIYSQDPDFETKAGYTTSGSPTATSITQISSIIAEGIAVNPSNPDDLLILQGIGGQIRRASNASTATGTGDLTVTTLPTIASPNPGVYDAIIDRNNPDVMVFGTSHGAFVTEDGGATYYDASMGFENVPVLDVKQSWRTEAEGNNRPGEIYLGTYGRGIWSSDSFSSIDDENVAENANTIEGVNISTFPNPTTANTTIAFKLKSDADVAVNVYDITGKLVTTISKDNMQKGEQELRINSAGFRTGTYIVRLKAGTNVHTTKFIKM